MIEHMAETGRRTQHSCVYVHMSRESRLMGQSRGRHSSTTNTTRAYTTDNWLCSALARGTDFFPNHMGGCEEDTRARSGRVVRRPSAEQPARRNGGARDKKRPPPRGGEG